MFTCTIHNTHALRAYNKSQTKRLDSLTRMFFMRIQFELVRTQRGYYPGGSFLIQSNHLPVYYTARNILITSWRMFLDPSNPLPVYTAANFLISSRRMFLDPKQSSSSLYSCEFPNIILEDVS
uniref:Uncharacterized protein n=1 Tax=Cacopsylla melanoneura TaxID=428564 RepID=A0A8D8W7D4_9HEMI